jgi:enamine deaminase RidA (YjgF/YER057c/UK114 family)
MMSIDRFQPGEWNARAVINNGTAYLSGVVADDTTQPMKEQTEEVLSKIDNVLASIGTDKSKILSSVVYLADMDQKGDMNEAWMAWIDKSDLPARAAVGVTLTPGHLVEIMVVAAV